MSSPKTALLKRIDVRNFEPGLVDLRREGDLARLHFGILHANGNVILVLDEGRSALSPQQANGVLARRICSFFGAPGVDGIVFLRREERELRMTFFDRDGTREPMCGNGLRCTARYAFDHGLAGCRTLIQTDDGEKPVWIDGERIRAGLGKGREYQVLSARPYFVLSSIPHLVEIVDDVASVDVDVRGRALRNDRDLCRRLGHPEGVHVDFVSRSGSRLRMRSYEVGVEGETLSCGSGAAAVGFVASRAMGFGYPIPVVTHGGTITVDESGSGLVISGEVGQILSTDSKKEASDATLVGLTDRKAGSCERRATL